MLPYIESAVLILEEIEDLKGQMNDLHGECKDLFDFPKPLFNRIAKVKHKEEFGEVVKKEDSFRENYEKIIGA